MNDLIQKLDECYDVLNDTPLKKSDEEEGTAKIFFDTCMSIVDSERITVKSARCIVEHKLNHESFPINKYPASCTPFIKAQTKGAIVVAFEHRGNSFLNKVFKGLIDQVIKRHTLPH